MGSASGFCRVVLGCVLLGGSQNSNESIGRLANHLPRVAARRLALSGFSLSVGSIIHSVYSNISHTPNNPRPGQDGPMHACSRRPRVFAATCTRMHRPTRPQQSIPDHRGVIKFVPFIDRANVIDSDKLHNPARRDGPSVYLGGGTYAPAAAASSTTMAARHGRSLGVGWGGRWAAVKVRPSLEHSGTRGGKSHAWASIRTDSRHAVISAVSRLQKRARGRSVRGRFGGWAGDPSTAKKDGPHSCRMTHARAVACLDDRPC